MNDNHFYDVNSKANGLGWVGVMENGVLTLTSQWFELIVPPHINNGVLELDLTGLWELIVRYSRILQTTTVDSLQFSLMGIYTIEIGRHCKLGLSSPPERHFTTRSLYMGSCKQNHFQNWENVPFFLKTRTTKQSNNLKRNKIMKIKFLCCHLNIILNPRKLSPSL